MKSLMVPRYTLVYITDKLPMFIRNIAIIMTGTFGFNIGKLFCRPGDPVFWCLFIGLPSNLPDMTGGQMVFREVDRSVNPLPEDKF